MCVVTWLLFYWLCSAWSAQLFAMVQYLFQRQHNVSVVCSESVRASLVKLLVCNTSTSILTQCLHNACQYSVYLNMCMRWVHMHLCIRNECMCTGVCMQWVHVHWHIVSDCSLLCMNVHMLIVHVDIFIFIINQVYVYLFKTVDLI